MIRVLTFILSLLVSLLYSCGGSGAGDNIRSALFGGSSPKLEKANQIPPITSSIEGRAISEDGKIVVGYSLPADSAIPYYWKLRDNVTHQAFMFLEDQNSFQKEPIPIPSGVPYDYVIITNMSIEGKCIVGNAHKYNQNITTPLMWTLDLQSGMTATILPTICPTDYGNIPYDCAVIGDRYVVAGRTCPEVPYATIWENGNKVFESKFGTCYGILHSISSNEVISGAACFNAVIWRRGQGANPEIDESIYSRYDSVISEDGSVIAFGDESGSQTTVWKDGKKVRVNSFYPTAVIVRSNNLAVVYGKDTSNQTHTASRFTVDFSQSQPAASQKENLNDVFSHVIPQGVILESVKDVTTDEKFILCNARLSNNHVTPCIISVQHASLTYRITVNSTGNGRGSISSNPMGINYTYPSASTGSANFSQGSTVVITATANEGSRVSWYGTCQQTGGTETTVSSTEIKCTFNNLNSSKSITATFTAIDYTLNVTRQGNGSGTITSNPEGIDCGQTCSANFPANTQVILTANAAGNSVFAGWGGDCASCGNNTACPITMNSNKSCTTTFNLKTYTITVTKTGDGTITAQGCTLNWSGNTGTCIVNHGSNVTLTAAPASGYNFGGWSGACSGTNTTCNLSNITENKTVNASFVGAGGFSGTGAGCSIGYGASPVNGFAWLLLPLLILVRRIRKGSLIFLRDFFKITK